MFLLLKNHFGPDAETLLENEIDEGWFLSRDISRYRRFPNPLFRHKRHVLPLRFHFQKNALIFVQKVIIR